MDLNTFENPTALYRPAPFWSWNDKLDKEELKRQIKEMAEKGWGSYFMHSRVGLVTGYMSEEWMDMIDACAQEARNTNTYAWLYDEDKWPSGFAGGEVPLMEESYRSRALVLLSDTEIGENDSVLSEISVNSEKCYICKRVSSLNSTWFNGTSYVDLMNPEAVQAFINCTHEKYKKTCGEYFGKEIPGIFTDEPCYLMEGHYNVPVLPWSDYLPSYFQQHKGYSIEENLEELFSDVGNYRKIRFDFFDCATRLFMESFTKPYYQWCEQNNLIMTGHFMAEDDLCFQTKWVGAAMPHYEFMHWPGIDKLGRHIEQLVTVKQVTSVADQLNKERSFCEVFGCVGQQVSFYHRKWISDWQASLGISFVNSHLSLYSMRGERKRDYPANLFYQQPWWDYEKPFSDYIGRLSYAVSEGTRDVDILVIHPIASVWSEYSPVHKSNGLMIEKRVYDMPFEQLSKELMANKLDFHYGDEIIMEQHAEIKDGKLVIGCHSYSTVIVPPCCTLRKSTIDILEQFVQQSSKERLIFLQTFPDRIDGIKSEVSLLNKAVKLSSIQKAIDVLDKYYQNRIRIIDKNSGDNAIGIMCHTRSTESGKLFFICNTNDKREVTVSIQIPGIKSPRLLDLMSGEIYIVPATFINGMCCIDTTFYPAGSLLLLDQIQPIQCRQSPETLDSGVSFAGKCDNIEIINHWEVNILENNVLPLNDATLYLDGKQVLASQPVSKAWHEYFYKAADGTPFKAEYRFEVLHVPDGPVFAAIETAENLDRLTLNNIELTPLKQKGEPGCFDKEKSWKDPNFTKVPLERLICKGENILVLEGKKFNNITGPGCHISVPDFHNHFATEVEAVYIVGNFQVTDIGREVFMIDRNNTVNNPANLTSSGYPFYAGKAEFKANIKYAPSGRQVMLKINDVEAACVELYVNGKQVSVKYWRPYIIDITDFIKDGENEIKIVAASTLFNLMGPNRISEIKNLQYVSPNTFIDISKFTKQYTLLPFGIGRVYLDTLSL